MYDGRLAASHNVFGCEILDESKVLSWGYTAGCYGYSDRKRNFSIWRSGGDYCCRNKYGISICISKVYNYLDDDEKELFIKEELDLVLAILH